LKKTRTFLYIDLKLLPRFDVPFWLSHILVYLFYFCPRFCPSWDRNNN